MPALVNGVTTVKVQGKYDLGAILLITNVTKNEILYNFSDPLNPAIITYDSTYNSNGLENFALDHFAHASESIPELNSTTASHISFMVSIAPPQSHRHL